MPERYLGKTLGKYRVEELIGSGGFSWVYRGFDPELEIPVALKVLKPQFGGDNNFEERFRREASTAARLRHPNIIKIYAVGRDGDAVYFAMDYLSSGLADKLEATASLPEEFTVRVGIDVARALGFAHREGVIHRDIKVDNILFDAHGNAVVADFGIARAVSGYTQQTGTNMVVGTPQYFAPEQARAKPLDGRADIYSLGVSLFRTATGRLPFEGDDWYEIARQHVEEAPPRPRSINPAISGAFERVVLRCLAKHPDDRPTTGEQLADELVEVLTSPREATTGRSVLRSPNENPTVVTTPAALPGRAPVTSRGRVSIAGPIAVAVAAAIAVAFPFVFARDDAAATTDSTNIALLPPVSVGPAPGDTIAVSDSASSDSARAVTPGRRDSAALARTRYGRLVANAPDGSTLFINGVVQNGNSVTRDSLSPGTYTVRATVPSVDGCDSSSDEQQVVLRGGVTQRVALDPRPCGELRINVRNRRDGASYMISGDGQSRLARNGSVHAGGAAVILPVGTYTLRVQQPGCNPYEEPGVNVSAQGTSTRTVTLDCDGPAAW
ncbi:MAG: protein kinase domain-containing protein [Gemmatimonadota bacterium]